MSVWKAVLIFVVTASAPVLPAIGAADAPKVEQQVPVDQELEEIRDEIRRLQSLARVPDNTVRLARDAFYGRRTTSKRDRVQAVNELRVFALQENADMVQANLTYVRNHLWESGFVRAFANAAAWADDIRAKDGAEVFALSDKWARDKSHPSNENVSWWLRALAIEKRHSPAVFEDVIKRLARPYKPGQNTARSWLRDLGWQGYKPALPMLIQGYMRGGVFQKHMGVAYFWYLHAQSHDLDVSPWRDELEAQATDEDRAWARRFIRDGVFPEPWEYRDD